MNIENITLNHSITIDEYNDLRASVDFITIRENRARIALDHSLYTLIARENGRPVGMARVVGDGGYVYFICDVIVRPSHQSQGLGRYIIEHVLSIPAYTEIIRYNGLIPTSFPISLGSKISLKNVTTQKRVVTIAAS